MAAEVAITVKPLPAAHTTREGTAHHGIAIKQEGIHLPFTPLATRTCTANATETKKTLAVSHHVTPQTMSTEQEHRTPV